MNLIPASPALREFVGGYLYWEHQAPDQPLVRPVPARPDLFVAFYLREPYAVWDHRTGRTRRLPGAVVVGAQTTRVVDLLITGPQCAWYIFFRPAGLYRLFGVTAARLTNEGYSATEVLGADAVRLHLHLHHADSPAAMARATEEVLRGRLCCARPAHPVRQAASALLQRHGRIPLDALATASSLSRRHFERTFVEQIGMAPKRYARVARFQFALHLKRQRPALTWTEISQTAGYFDQAHLIKDFRALAGAVPSSFLRLLVDPQGRGWASDVDARRPAMSRSYNEPDAVPA